MAKFVRYYLGCNGVGRIELDFPVKEMARTHVISAWSKPSYCIILQLIRT